MRLYIYFCLIFFSFTLQSSKATVLSKDKDVLYHNLSVFVKSFKKEYKDLPVLRVEKIKEIGLFVRACREKGLKPILNFVDKENDTRSQMLLVWAKSAALHFGVEDVGINAFGLKPKTIQDYAVRSLEKSGFIAYREKLAHFTYYNIYFGYGKKGCEIKPIALDKTSLAQEGSLTVYCDNSLDSAFESLKIKSRSIADLSYSPPKSKLEFEQTNRQIGLEMFYLFAHLKL